MSVRVSVTQFAVQLDLEHNLKEIEQGVIEGVRQGAQLCVFPEKAMWTDPAKSGVVPPAQALDGPFVTSLQRMAIENQVDVVAGMSERIPDETRCFNTLVHIDSLGTMKGIYRKVHLYDAFGSQESTKVRPGEIVEPYVFAMGGLTFGMMTCYDLRFPESSRRLVDAGANVLLAPSAWNSGPMKEFHWDLLSRARAVENTVYLVAVDQTTKTYVGQSQIIDPMGVPIAAAGEQPSTVSATLNPERIEEVRRVVPCLANRRFSVV